jgi:glycosyltransferase involved in cell wall biosynthesis
MDETFALMGDEGLKEHICRPGYLNDDDLRALYSSCGAFIYPSLYEGFGLPPLEAMACGAPVIASRIPALQETLGESAILVDSLDANALAQTIIALLQDGRRRDEFIEKGQQRVKAFNWDRAATATYEIYSQAIG